MRNFTTKIFFLFLLSIFSLVISCQTEEVVLKQFGKELPVTKKQVRYLDSKQSRHISSKLASKLNKPFGKNDSYDFTTLSIAIGEVDLTKVLEITNDYGVTNYTYLVNSSLSSDSKFFNLVYSVFEEKESVTLLEFTMAEDFKEDYYNKIKSIAQFKGTINSTVITNSFPCPEVTIDPGDDIQNGGSETSTIPNDSSINDSNPVSGGGFNNGNDTPGGGGGEQFDCGWLIVIIQCNGGGGHDGSYAGCNGPFKGATYLVDSCNGAFVQFYKTGKNENYNTESDGDTGDGDPCPPADGIGIIEPSSAFMNFVFNLPTDLKNWLTKPYPQGASDEIKDLIEEFVNQGGNQDFARELIVLAIQNPTIYTSERMINWFFTPREGQDFFYDATFWENPNLSFPQQDLPTWDDFDLAYPRDNGADLVLIVGGAVQQAYNDYPSLSRGYCALKVSRALNYSGITIPQITTTANNPGTIQGNDEMYYFLNAKALNKWMKKTFGTNPATISAPYNENHIHIDGSEGGENGINFPGLVSGLKGIYSMVSTNPQWASGHADLIQDGLCVFGCHFLDTPPAPIDFIDIWVLE
jgi:hypothetical protein